MAIKLVVGGSTLNMISAYAPQVGLDEGIKKHFWEEVDGLVRGIPLTEKLFIGGDFNGHIGVTSGGYDNIHDGFGLGVRNGGGTSLLDCAKAFDLVIANSYFPKREEHLVIPSENLTTQHRLLVMDSEIMWKRKKRAVYGQPRIRWGALTSDKAQELGRKLLAMGA
uniref:Craniofacial development protein 2-like n=1 Tax=Nicotiana tabacum TaxID=4097 RepID=A0A1S3ZWT5_TOBAC|nr:PREDICTED: craniofacial development protein 2-like [Nicotiana tabacum]